MTMDSIRSRYQNDPEFNRLVRMLEGAIEAGQLTGSEVREAAMLACINYENRTLMPRIVIPDDVNKAIEVIEKYSSSQLAEMP